MDSPKTDWHICGCLIYNKGCIFVVKVSKEQSFQLTMLIQLYIHSEKLIFDRYAKYKANKQHKQFQVNYISNVKGNDIAPR